MVRNDKTSRARRILVVDNESSLTLPIHLGLSRSGYDVDLAADASSARASIAHHRPDLAIIEWALPGPSGLELTRSIKEDPSIAHIPVIMVSTRGEDYDKVLGLDSGADDYVTKPFSLRELLARIEAVLRRVYNSRMAVPLRANGLALEPGSQRVTAGGKVVSLGPLEFRLLAFLMSHAGRVHSRAQLLDRVWGTHGPLDERTVDVEISRLRRALRTFECDGYVQTVHGAGYRFSTHTK